MTVNRQSILCVGLAATTALWGCAPSGVTPESVGQRNPVEVQRSAQQYEGGTGTRICYARYRNCVRTLRRSLGRRTARRVCRERWETCINALGEGYFYRAEPTE